MMPRSAIKTSLIVAAVVSLAALGAWWGFSKAKTQNTGADAASAAPVSIAKSSTVELSISDVFTAKQQPLVQSLRISGALKATNSALVKARVSGELQGLLVREGDTVRAGQVLARVDASDLQSRVRQAQEQADAAKAQIDIAERSYSNNKALVDQGFISKTALDTSQANSNAARANHQAALAALDVAKKSAQDVVLKAPISGQVAQRFAQNGERVGIEARIVEIVDISRLELEAAVPTQDSARLRIGQEVALQIEGVAAPVAATVARIAPSAQASSRSVLAYLTLAPQAGLRQGLFAQGNLGVGEQTGVAVPVSAVRSDKPQPYVQVVQEGKLRHVSVQTAARGEIDGEAAVLIEGVAVGAQVVKGSVGRLGEGLEVGFTKAPAPTTKATP